MKKLKDLSEAQLTELMNAFGTRIKAVAAVRNVEKLKFVLLAFNDPSIAQYVANCDRCCVVRALRECADRLERHETTERSRFRS